MSDPRVSFPDVGDTLSGPTLWSIQDTITSAINDTEEGSLRRRSLYRANGPGSLRKFDSELKPQVSGATYTVTRAYPGWNTLANWQAIDITNGTTTATAAADAADTTKLEVSLDGGTGVDLSGSDLVGVEVRADIIVNQIYDADGSPAVNSSYGFAMAIQVLDGAGTWHHIARTERWCTGMTVNGPAIQRTHTCVAVATVVTEDDLGANTTIVGVRVVGACRNLISGSITATVNADLESGRLYASCYQAGSL